MIGSRRRWICNETGAKVDMVIHAGPGSRITPSRWRVAAWSSRRRVFNGLLALLDRCTWGRPYVSWGSQ